MKIKLLIVVLITILTSFFITSNVNAVSPQDNAYKTTEFPVTVKTTKLSDNTVCGERTFGSREEFVAMFRNFEFRRDSVDETASPPRPSNSVLLAGFDQALETGAWGISKETINLPGILEQTQLVLFWKTTPTELRWNGNSSYSSVEFMNSTASLTFRWQLISGNCQTGENPFMSISNEEVFISDSDRNAENLFVVGDFNPNYPEGYAGLPVKDFKRTVYPGMEVLVSANAPPDTSKVKLLFASTWADFLKNENLNPPNNSIFTLTDMDDNIIVPDRCWGDTGCDWNNLPNGDYKARVVVIYLSDDVNATYDFKTTEVWFQVNGTSYSMIYNPTEGRYCSVRGGYEWNCEIPQPGDEPSIIDGAPEEWVEEPCTIDGFPFINLGNCIRNALHYLGEYLGINGPSITPGSSMFFQFDTNTFGLTSILTAPITILNNLANSEYTCSTINLPLPNLGATTLQLPCMNAYYTTYLGQLYTLWQTVINGIVSYFVIVGILRMVKDAKDPQKDKIEVLAL